VPAAISIIKDLDREIACPGLNRPADAPVAHNHNGGRLVISSDGAQIVSCANPLAALRSREWLLAEADRVLTNTGAQVAFLSVDIDRFKRVNAALGMDIGDLILAEVAGRLKKLFSRENIVGAASGDSFMLVIPDCDRRRAAELAEDVLKTVSAPFPVPETTVSVSASIGIAIVETPPIDPSAVMAQAEIAVDKAKSAGGNRYCFHEPFLCRAARETFLLENALRRAIARNAIALAYQPQVSLPSTRLYGVEALARWIDPDLGEIPPSRFIPLAEEIGLIEQLEKQLLKSVCRDMASWRREGIPVPRVSVNLSPAHFGDRDLAAFVAGLLYEFELPADILTIEIVESAMICGHTRGLDVVEALRQIGVRLSLDDFGTGFSNLTHLDGLPVSEIKIDSNFIRKIEENQSTRAIVAAITGIAHGLGKMVIAEGVETKRQADILGQLGCETMQGFLFSPPMLPAELKQWARSVTQRYPEESGTAKQPVKIAKQQQNAWTLTRCIRAQGHVATALAMVEDDLRLKEAVPYLEKAAEAIERAKTAEVRRQELLSNPKVTVLKD